MKTIKMMLAVLAIMGLAACSSMKPAAVAAKDMALKWPDNTIDWAKVDQVNKSARRAGATIVWINYPQKNPKHSDDHVADNE